MANTFYQVTLQVIFAVRFREALINDNNLSRRKLYWQNGYGVFSYSISHRQNVINYIQNQQIHHQKSSFREEYINFLEVFNVRYNQKYLIDFFDM